MRTKVVDQRGEGVLVQSSSDPEKWYEVDLGDETCDCPHWKHRLQHTGGWCKHMKEAKIAVEKMFAERLGPERLEAAESDAEDGYDPFGAVWG